MVVLMSATIETMASERRTTARHTVHLQATASGHDDQSETVEVRDLSTTGFLMEAATPLSIGDKIKLHFADVDVDGEVVWLSASVAGCQFSKRLTKAQLSSALLRSQPTARISRPGVELELRKVSKRLGDVARDLNAIERTLASAEPSRPMSSAPDLVEEPLASDDKYPVHVRVWTILLSSIALWAILLTLFGIL